MEVEKTVAFIDALITKTKNNAISWSQMKIPFRDESFPRLDCKDAYYCEINGGVVAIGLLLDQYVDDTDVGLFLKPNKSRTFSLLECTALNDAQDLDLIYSKTFRLHDLVSASDDEVEKFIDEFLQ